MNALLYFIFVYIYVLLLKEYMYKIVYLSRINTIQNTSGFNRTILTEFMLVYESVVICQLSCSTRPYY